jgi:hypothetical protein
MWAFIDTATSINPSVFADGNGFDGPKIGTPLPSRCDGYHSSAFLMHFQRRSGTSVSGAWIGIESLTANGVVLEGTFGDWAIERWRESPARRKVMQ